MTESLFGRKAIVVFDQRTNRRAAEEAIRYAEVGGQALHIWDPRNQPGFIARAPLVFRSSFPWAHLIDHDLGRLVSVARRFGVRRTVVGREGGRGQHIDLVGRPLKCAIAAAAIHAGYEDVIFEYEEQRYNERLVTVMDFRFARPLVAH